MESLNSFKGYGKVDPIEEQSFRRKTRRRIIIVAVSVVLLVAIVVGAVAGTVVHHRKNVSSAADVSPADALKAVCGVTQYPDSCISSIGSLNNSSTTDPEELFKLSLQVALKEFNQVASFPETFISKTDDESVKLALEVCKTMMEDSVDRLQDSISAVNDSSQEEQVSKIRIENLRTWLSATLTDHETCLDALRDVNSTVSQSVLEEVSAILKNSTEYASNSLAIATNFLGVMSSYKIPSHRKLLEEMDSAFPSWLRAADQRLLQMESEVMPNVTVAMDGSGDYKTINEALAVVPKKSEQRFVIYVKAGVYNEFVSMDKSFQNVMIYGDGMYKTIIMFDRNKKVAGIPTFSTATFAVTGKNFIARDVGFKNNAGAVTEQAVALRSGSDFSVFYRCSFDAYQDTLYPHSNRQFYRECDITGTVDFIFGNAAVVFQNCKILARQPLPNQIVTITAQGKKDPNENTGISIHKCTISKLDDDLTAKTYLGRPWKPYSTTIIMQTNIDSIVDPSGWVAWIPNVEPPSTIFYAEYENNGPGSSVSNRVTWAGYKPSITSNEASKFSVLGFIGGTEWLPATGVTYDSSLN